MKTIDEREMQKTTTTTKKAKAEMSKGKRSDSKMVRAE